MDGKSQQPVGPPVDPKHKLTPPADVYRGKDVTLERMDPQRHGPGLFAALQGRRDLWTYMLNGPFDDDGADFQEMLRNTCSHAPGSGNVDLAGRPVMFFYAIVRTPPTPQLQHNDAQPTMLGYLALFRIDWVHQTAEIGHVMLLPALQRTRGATEAHYLLMRAAFQDVGVRRLEWKCNHLHAGSRRAALRLGYTFEGIFRKHYIVKGHSRDTAWFSITDDEWPAVRAGLDVWLAENNFDEQGQQVASLEALREHVKGAQ